MPGLITHLLCSHHVANNVDTELQSIIKKYPAAYYLGSQGPDIFFYYLPAFLSKETFNLGLVLHKQNTGEYIMSLLDNARNLDGDKKEVALSYICGYLTHYGLDSKTHPYIYYKTGFKQKGNIIKSLKHSLYHRKLETSIDTLLLKNLTHKKPSEKSLWEFFDLTDIEEDVISEIVSKSLNYAYGRYISKKKTKSILKYVVLATKYFQSAEGKQMKVREFLDDLTLGDEIYSSLEEEQGEFDYFNLNKNSWHTPWDNEVKKHETFGELYNKGIEESVMYANNAHLYVNNYTSTKYMQKIVKNLSMASGEDCVNNLEWKHYEVIFHK